MVGAVEDDFMVVVENNRTSEDLQQPSRALSNRSSLENRGFEETSRQGLRKFSRKKRQVPLSPAQQWPTLEPKGNAPYHEYVHRLVEAGWDNLTDLDKYMATDYEDADLIISVVDFTDHAEIKRQEDLRSVTALQAFLDGDSRDGVRVRLYLAEQRDSLSSAVMEAFGTKLNLDPRFFQWNISGSKNLMSPADRHRVPFTNIGFTVLDPSTPKMTDTSFFRVTVYIQPDREGEGWTGIILFSSHLKTNMSVNTVLTPPTFDTSTNPDFPSPVTRESKSFRELYLSALPFLVPQEVLVSPFYTVHHLFRLNRRCWSDVISAIREQDVRVNGISEASVSHVEDIKKTFDIVKRGGSWGWAKSLTPISVESKDNLEEDYTHLLKQADFLWESREKMAAVRRRKSEARWNALTNSFTFVFIPITVISGIYGMNVAEINGSTPDIWQFFAATAVMDMLIVLALALYSWVHIASKQQRMASFREVFRFAFGRH